MLSEVINPWWMKQTNTFPQINRRLTRLGDRVKMVRVVAQHISHRILADTSQDLLKNLISLEEVAIYGRSVKGSFLIKGERSLNSTNSLPRLSALCPSKLGCHFVSLSSDQIKTDRVHNGPHRAQLLKHQKQAPLIRKITALKPLFRNAV
jgi:hypothetical protein